MFRRILDGRRTPIVHCRRDGDNRPRVECRCEGGDGWQGNDGRSRVSVGIDVLVFVGTGDGVAVTS